MPLWPTPKPSRSRSPIPNDVDPAETAEWLESLDYVLESKGPERVQQLLSALEEAAIRNGVELPFTATTPYVNTIPRRQAAAVPRQPRARTPHQELHPLERDGDGHPRQPRLRAASADTSRRSPRRPTLYEVGFNHFFRGRGESGYDGDQIYFQGHASPGMYARAFLEGRLTETEPDQLPPRAEPKGAGCRRIRIRG